MTIETVYRYFCNAQIIQVYDNKQSGLSLYYGRVEFIPFNIFDRFVTNVYTMEKEDVIYIVVD